jgi:hypothetical protein
MNAEQRRRLADRLDWWGKRASLILLTFCLWILLISIYRTAIDLWVREPIAFLWIGLGLIAGYRVGSR